MINTKKSLNKGFTIVELLIVVVVIAILAAITIVAYTGIANQAKQAAMKANIEQTAKLLANYKTLNGAYPTSLSVLNDGQGPKSNADTLYAYTIEGTDYCLTIGSTNANDTYFLCGNSPQLQGGTYATHTGMIGGYPTREGATDITTPQSTTSNVSRADVSSVPTGSWMIVVLSYLNAADPTPPAGWTALTPRKTTGTMQTSIYAKIKQAGDSDNQDFVASGSNGTAFTNAGFVWGRNSAPVSSWIVGSYGDRGTNATATTAVTPTISVTTAKSLVISIATERTTAAETNYTSLTGATSWLWVPQPDTSKIQTIAIAYNAQANTGTSQAMTITYPNSQAVNATAIQIAIPPSN